MEVHFTFTFGMTMNFQGEEVTEAMMKAEPHSQIAWNGDGEMCPTRSNHQKRAETAPMRANLTADQKHPWKVIDLINFTMFSICRLLEPAVFCWIYIWWCSQKYCVVGLTYHLSKIHSCRESYWTTLTAKNKWACFYKASVIMWLSSSNSWNHLEKQLDYEKWFGGQKSPL